MITVAELKRRVQSVNLDNVVTESIEDSNKEFIELQTEQMYEGFLSTGDPISPPYTARTVKIKKEKGQRYDVVTLNDTNAFYEQMNITVDDEMIQIDSPVPYAKDLERKYGVEIYGLTEENRKEFVWDDLFPKVKQKIEQTTKLNF
jgi:hypothetical protein